MTRSTDDLVKAVTEWLMAKGIVGWEMSGDAAPLELRLNWENRRARTLIERQFGAAVQVHVKPEGAPVYRPQTIGPAKPNDP